MPEGPQLEVGAQRAPRLLVNYIYLEHVHRTFDMSSLILLLRRPQRINQCNLSWKEKNKPLRGEAL